MLLHIHPDFLWNKPLARKINQYEFFSYSVNEACIFGKKKKQLIAGLLQGIEQEYRQNIDKFSRRDHYPLELLLTYAERFYHRQFITRKDCKP